MGRRRKTHGAKGMVANLAGVLCALALLGGCAQQPQTAETGQGAEQGQAATTEADASQAAAEEAGTAGAEGSAAAASEEREQEQAGELAREYLDEAATHEPAITRDLQAQEGDGASLEGLDFRFKSQESLTRKILLDAHTEEISLDEAASGISDVLRYTLCIEPDDYVAKATEALKDLESKGYTVTKFKNMWDGDTYKAINTKLTSQDGMLFELQLHTPDSLEMRERTHVYYEKARSEDATEEEVEEATRICREACAALEIPEGALEFTWE